MRAWFFVLFTILLVPSRASAGDYEDARRLDDEFRFPEALAAYDRASDPRTAAGAEAISRANVLRAHAEGNFLPFVALEKVRRAPSREADAQLARDADAFPPGPSRVEAWVVGAESALAAHDEASAEPILRKIASEAHADPVIQRKARRDLALALVHRNALSEARVIAETDPSLTPLIARLARRRYVHVASMAAVVVMPLLAIISIIRRRREAQTSVRAIAPLVVVYAAWLAIVGGVLSSAYESGTSHPFIVFALASSLVIILARAWSATSASSRNARIARATLSALAALATGFLVLEAIDVAYLDSLGL